MAHPLAEAGLLPWIDLDYDDELARKRAMVEAAFARRGVRAEVGEVVRSPRRTAARARAKFRAGPAGELGFYRPGSHVFVAPPLDDLVRPEVADAAGRIGGAGSARGEVELRSDGTRVVAEAATPCEGIDDLWAAGAVVRGNPTLRIDGLQISPGAFSQVNLEVNRLLVAAVDAELVRLKPEALLDLYGGVGNLSVAAARRSTMMTLVETSRIAALDAKANLAGTRATVVAADAGRIKVGVHIFDVAIVDPPRAGAQGVLSILALTRPRAILYVSCDPHTLARDISSIKDGYFVSKLSLFDMFPGAEHIESLCVLERIPRR